MADPAYYESRSFIIQIHQKEHRFTLYLSEGDGETKNILGDDAAASNFGNMGVVDWAIYDGPEKGSKLVARAQGQRLGVGSSTTGGAMLNCFILTFVDERFRNSSLKVRGEIGDEEGECEIIGGTGKFACAQGVVVFKKGISGSRTTKLDVRALCLVMSPTDTWTVDQPTIDSVDGSTVVTLTDDLTGQGDNSSGHDESLATPTSKHNSQAGQGGTASKLNSAGSSTKPNNKRSSEGPPVGAHEPPNKRVDRRSSFDKS